MYIHQYNGHDSIYDINRKQERDIKSLQAELTRVRNRANGEVSKAASAERDLRKARRTIEMQEAQMQNMQKEISRLRGDQRTYRCEASLVVKQSDEINELRAKVKRLNVPHATTDDYLKLVETKNRFKKALAAELDGEDSTRIIDILTEEAPKPNEYYFDIEATQVGTINGIKIHQSHNTWW